MTILRTYKFKLLPSKVQHHRLHGALDRSRQIYNAALEERIDCYRKTGEGRSYIDQCGALVELRREGTPYASSMERAPLRALDRAYKAFFSRGGFPRFKGRGRFKSIAWSDKTGWRFDGRFSAKGIGRIRVKQHRYLPSEPKSARIKREGKHWFLLLICERGVEHLADSGRGVGVDLGISHFAALSDGGYIENPRVGRKAQRKLRVRQRALARCKRGSKRRTKASARLASAYSKVKRQRRTSHFQMAARLCREYSAIAIENLNVRALSSGMLARDVNDAAWGQFIKILSDKAESAGRTVVRVNPRGTSQQCPECGTTKVKALAERIHRCRCGYVADRDVAAARVIHMRAVLGPPAVNVAGCGARSQGKAAHTGVRNSTSIRTR